MALDLCAPIASVPYPLASEAGLAETVRLVGGPGTSDPGAAGDVRSRADQQRVVDEGIEESGRLDFAVANAGIFPVPGEGVDEEEACQGAIDVLLKGVWHTLKVVVASRMVEGGRGESIVLTSSTAGSLGLGRDHRLRRGEARGRRCHAVLRQPARSPLNPCQHGAPKRHRQVDDHQRRSPGVDADHRLPAQRSSGRGLATRRHRPRSSVARLG